MDVTADVVVVGAGPTGLLSALLLADRGHRVALVERWPEPYPLPRAVGISHESLRALQSARVIDDVLPDLLFTADGSRVTEICAADGEVLVRRQDRAESISGWPERASFCQPDLERVLNARAAAHPRIELLRGWTVTRVGDTFVEASGGTVHGRFILGCDGANSAVRGDGEVVDLGFAFDWLVVDVIPHAERRFHPHLGQILGPPRPTTLVGGGPGRRRFEFMRLDGETKEELDRPGTAWRLLAPFDVRPDNATLERHAVYTFRGRWATHWRSGHRLLAGDAAHLMPPFLGEGFNSGIRDAVAVAWRLDLVLRGHAPLALLDTYSTERLGHVRQVIEQAVEVGRVICVSDPAEARARDRCLRESGLAGRRPWRLGPGMWLPDDPHAGHLGVQGRITAGGRTGRFDDVIGPGAFVLLGHGDAAAHVPPGERERWAAIGGRIVQIDPGSDVDGTYAKWFRELGIAVAVLRPDFAVFGTGAALGDAGRLVTATLDMLSVSSERP